MNDDSTMKPTPKTTKHDWSRFDAMSDARAMLPRSPTPMRSRSRRNG